MFTYSKLGETGLSGGDILALLEDRHPRQAAARVKRALAGDPVAAAAFARELLPHLDGVRACKRAAALVLHGAEAANPDAFRGGRLSRPFRRLLTEAVRTGDTASELARTRARVEKVYRLQINKKK